MQGLVFELSTALHLQAGCQSCYPVATYLLKYTEIILLNSQFTTLFIPTDVKARTHWSPS